MAVCQDKIAAKPHTLSDDGRFSWEEVECLGSCANAPMAQIGKDYYEDLTAERFAEMLDELAAGKVPVPGPQNGRYAAEPLSGLTSLTEYESGRTQYNASAQLAVDIGDTIKRIDGTEVPLLTQWRKEAANSPAQPAAKTEPTQSAAAAPAPTPVEPAGVLKPSTALPGQDELASRKGVWRYTGGDATEADAPEPQAPLEVAETEGEKPALLDTARGGKPDDLKMIKGVGPKLESALNSIGVFHFDQIASWSPAEVAWADQNLVGFKGRVSRDDWVDQAKALAAGEETEFSKRAARDELYD